VQTGILTPVISPARAATGHGEKHADPARAWGIEGTREEGGRAVHGPLKTLIPAVLVFRGWVSQECLPKKAQSLPSEQPGQ